MSLIDMTEIELLREQCKALKDDQEIKGGIIIALTQQIADLKAKLERLHDDTHRPCPTCGTKSDGVSYSQFHCPKCEGWWPTTKPELLNAAKDFALLAINAYAKDSADD